MLFSNLLAIVVTIELWLHKAPLMTDIDPQLQSIKCAIGINQLVVSEGRYLLQHLFIERSADVDEPCRWKGVACEKGVITHIDWCMTGTNESVQLETLLIKWIPPTVKFLLIFRQRQARKEPLETRYFPRMGLEIRIEECDMKGTPDLKVLPLELRFLSLRGNFLHGHVNLCRLPELLEKLDLRETKIDFVIVDNYALHNALEWARISCPQRNILWDSIKAVEVNEEDIDQRISVFSYAPYD